jgi:hypothetical protein
MRRVYKYPVPVNKVFTLKLPEKAEILTVQMQQDNPKLWVLVEVGQPAITRTFRLAETGYDIEEENLVYINTFQVDSGQLIYHLFEVK